MARVKSTGNESTEMRLVREFRKNRITGWRRSFKLIGRPDFVFPKSRLVIFLDGCFWHGCPLCRRIPKSNSDYWIRKIGGNIKRDAEISIGLKCRGWTVLRFWEHELKKDSMVGTLEKILSTMAVGRKK